MRRLSYTIVALILALSVGAGIKPIAQTALPAVPEAHAANVPIVLIGSVSGWNASTSPNPTITVAQGDTVSITLSSTDVTHQFALDVDRDGPKFIFACPTGDTCSNTFNPTTGTMVAFTAPAAATYTYFCTFHPTMVGNFVVTSSPPPPPTAPATFVHGKLSWTHHLSLTKNPAGLQTFTAHVLDTGSSNTIAIVHLKGISSTFSAESSRMMLQPGVVTDIMFSSAVSSFKNTKVCFTATLTFGPQTGLENTSPLTKTGCFAVVP